MKTKKDPALQLVKLQKISGVMKKLFIGGIVAIVVLLLLMLVAEDLGNVWLAIMAAAIAFTAIGGIGGKIVASKIKKDVATGITRQVLEEVMDSLEVYNPKGSVSKEYIRIDVGYPIYDRIGHCGDYVKGVYRGIPFETSDFELERKKEETNSEGETQITWETVFRGRIIICRHKWALEGSVTVNPQIHFLGGQKTESMEFNSRFSTHADNDHDLFYVLTPPYMETLLKLDDEQGGKKLIVRYGGDGTCIIVLKDKDFFEVKDETDAEALKKKFQSQLDSIGDLLLRLGIPSDQKTNV